MMLRLLLEALDVADCEALRLGKISDKSALHDFRVRLRRLRTLEVAFRETLHNPRMSKSFQFLKKVMKKTNGYRDLEVQLTWIDELNFRRGSSRLTRQGLKVCRQLLLQKKKSATKADFNVICEGYKQGSRFIRENLEQAQSRIKPKVLSKERLLQEVLVLKLQEVIQGFQTYGVRAKRVSDQKAIHRSRLCVKEMRYLLEPLAWEMPRGKEVLRALKSLQQGWGDLHDCLVREKLLSGIVKKKSSQLSEKERGSLENLLSEVQKNAVTRLKRLQSPRRQKQTQELILSIQKMTEPWLFKK